MVIGSSKQEMTNRMGNPTAYFELIQRGVDFIEEKLDETLTLSDVADASGLSAWHFQRVFKAVTHETLKGYIRSRRLSVALQRLTSTEMRIIDIALAAGFESQESFSRAFKKVFDIAPAEARKLRLRNPYFDKLIFNREYLRHLNHNIILEPEIYTQPALRMIGMCTGFYGEESEKNNMADKLPRLWEAFLPRIGSIAHRVPDLAYGVIQQTDPHSELLEYTAACVVTTARYARFRHQGLPTELNNTISYIYSGWLVHSGYMHTYGADLVMYGSEYKPGDHSSAIYYSIPIR